MSRHGWLSLIFAGSMVVSFCGRAEEKPTPPKRPKAAKTEMTDEQRAQLEQRLDEAWSKLSLREKSMVMKLQNGLREMTPEQRKFIYDRIERFITMPAEEKKRLRENSVRWKKMAPEQREQARKQFQERRHAYEEKWRHEHPGEEPPPYPYGKHKPATPPAPAANPETNNPKGK